MLTQALLTQLKHTNHSTRVNALHGLRDLLQTNPQLLPLNLAKLVEQVLVAVCDESSQVRHALSILVGFIVNASPAEKLIPFSSLIIAHLNCGLTHIDEKIQIDTLKIFDHFLSKPSIVASHAKSILPLLIKLISRQKANPTEDASKSSILKVLKGKFSAIKRSTLASNPDSKLADQSVTMQVLIQISKLLESVHHKLQDFDSTEKKNSSNGPIVDTVNKSVLIPNHSSSGTHLIDFSSPIPHVPIFRYSGVYLYTKSHDTQISDSDKDTVLSLSELQHIMTILSELLIDSFIGSLSTPSTNTNNFSLITMIFQLFFTLLRFAESLPSQNSTSEPPHLNFTTFVTKFWNDFLAHSLSRFPIVVRLNFSSFVTLVDLYTCLVTVKLLEIVPNARNAKEALVSITTYLGGLSSVNLDTCQNTQACVEILVQVYPYLVSLSDAFVRDLLPPVTVGMTRLFMACHCLSQSRQLFHKCFGDLLKLPLRETIR